MWVDTVKKYLKFILAAIVALVVAFGAGRYSKPDKVVTTTVETKVRDEEYTRQQVASARAEWERTTHSTTTSTTVIAKPCPPPTTEPYTCKPPCATDCSKCPSQVVSNTTTTTTDTNEHGTSNSNTTSNEHGTSHTTDTTHTTTTTTNNESGSKNWSLGLVAEGTFFNGKAPSLDLTYGATVGYRLIGPLSATASVYTNKNLVAGLSLDLSKNWSVSAEAGSQYTTFKPYYGGSVGYRVVGPVWVSAWGYSDRTFGLAASFTVK